MKKLISLILALAMTATMAACSNTPASSTAPPASEQTSSAPAAEKTKVGFVVKVINPFFTVMLDGAQKKADELGIELLVGAASEQTKTEEQISIVQDMVSKGVKAICIAPMDSEALLPCLADAQKAGVVVINLDNRLNPDTAAERAFEQAFEAEWRKQF